MSLMAADHVLTRTLVKPGAYALAHWKNVAIIVWRGRPDGQAVREVSVFSDRLLQEYAVFSVVHVVEETSGLPTSDGRHALVAAARKNSGHVACVGVLLPESRIVASMLRVSVRAMHKLVRGMLEVAVEPTLDALVVAMVDTHVRRSGTRLTASELARAIQEARSL